MSRETEGALTVQRSLLPCLLLPELLLLSPQLLLFRPIESQALRVPFSLGLVSFGLYIADLGLQVLDLLFQRSDAAVGRIAASKRTQLNPIQIIAQIDRGLQRSGAHTLPY